MTISQKIRTYHDRIDDPHNRFRSWEHCYAYFRNTGAERLSDDPDRAALHLAFYLASWGMYRASSFLFHHAYTAHLGVVDQLADSRFAPLWDTEFGASQTDEARVQMILDAAEAIRGAYRPFAASRRPTDTLVTKVMLGTFGCLPACDRFFREGFKCAGFGSSSLNRKFVEQVFSFCRENLRDFRREQNRIKSRYGVSYPLMKLVDMYFWQIGSEKELRSKLLTER